MSEPAEQPPDPGTTPPSGAPAAPPPDATQPAATQPTSPVHAFGEPAHPGQPYLPDHTGQPWQAGQPGLAGHPDQVGQPAQKGFPWLMIGSIVAAAVLVLCGGVGVTGYLMYSNAVGKGLGSPTEAVTRFLRATLVDHDARAAEKLVCSAARDHATLTNKIAELRRFDQKYPAPTYTWLEPTEVSRTSTTMKITTTVTLTTADDRTAERSYAFIAAKDNGWWVCDINPGS